MAAEQSFNRKAQTPTPKLLPMNSVHFSGFLLSHSGRLAE